MKLAFLRNKNKEYDPLSIETTDWFLKTKSGRLSPEEEVEFYAWIVENPKHKQKFEMANAIWHVPEDLADDLRKIAEMDDIQVEPHLPLKKRWFERINFRAPALRFSAMIAAVLIILVGLWMIKPDGASKVTYQSNTGEQKKLYFSDGSMVILDTQSVISRNYTEKSRNIELIKGRAFFSVAKDSDRPFVVTTGTVVARAVGTEFNVYRDGRDRISVTVTEGHVQVSRETGQFPAGGKEQKNEEKVSMSPEVIGSGQEIVIDDRQRKREIRSVDIQQANTWLEGRLYFQDAALKTVIDEINRYLVNKIIIKDYNTGNLTISLNYDIRRHDKFLATLEKVLPVAYETAPNGKIYLYEKK